MIIILKLLNSIIIVLCIFLVSNIVYNNTVVNKLETETNIVETEEEVCVSKETENKDLVEEEKELNNEEESSKIEEQVETQNNQKTTEVKQTVTSRSGANSSRTKVNKEKEEIQDNVQDNVQEEQQIEEDNTEENVEEIPKTYITFLRPVEGGNISSHYGNRKSGFHTGTDVSRPCNTPIYAAADGTVSKVGWSGGYGKLIIVDHTYGYQTYYAHCNGYNVEVGDTVNQGDIIGYVGTTGNSTGYHLHFEIRLNGETLNPEKYISF